MSYTSRHISEYFYEADLPSTGATVSESVLEATVSESVSGATVYESVPKNSGMPPYTIAIFSDVPFEAQATPGIQSTEHRQKSFEHYASGSAARSSPPPMTFEAHSQSHIDLATVEDSGKEAVLASKRGVTRRVIAKRQHPVLLELDSWLNIEKSKAALVQYAQVPRGHESTLGRIATALESEPHVQSAAVIHFENTVIGFVTPCGVNVENVKDAVRMRMPSFCVPGRIIVLDELPKQNSGNVDTGALQGIAASQKFCAVSLVNAMLSACAMEKTTCSGNQGFPAVRSDMSRSSREKMPSMER